MVSQTLTERIGIHRVALNFLEDFGWLEREQTVSDFGIDMQVELVENDQPTGLLYCIQVKSGDSYTKKTSDNLVFYTDQKHIDYWRNHSLPVILVISDINNNINYWQIIKSETIKQTNKKWKIDIPLTNILGNTESINEIKKLYFSDEWFTIMNSAIDTSHSLSRRISMKIILKEKVSNFIIEKQLPQLVEGLKNSDYYRSEIVEQHHSGNNADCVWIWFYRNNEQYNNGLPFCTAYWNDPESESPTILNKNDKLIIDNIYINYTKNELDSAFINKRLTKGKYLKIIDNYILAVSEIYIEIIKVLKKFNKNNNRKKLEEKIIKLDKIHSGLFDEEYNQNFEPLECHDLDQVIQNIQCAIDNIFIVIKDKNRDINNIKACMKIYIEEYEKNILAAHYERQKVI